MSEPFDETLARLDEWIERRREQRQPLTPEQVRVRQFRERMARDPAGAMRDTERALWAIRDADQPLDTSDERGPISGYQFYCWCLHYYAHRRALGPATADLFRWAMRALDRQKRASGLVATSEGWLPLGAVTPGNRNHLVPIEKVTEIDGQVKYIMAHKAVPDGQGGVKLAPFHPDLADRDREDRLRATFLGGQSHGRGPGTGPSSARAGGYGGHSSVSGVGSDRDRGGPERPEGDHEPGRGAGLAAGQHDLGDLFRKARERLVNRDDGDPD